MPVYFINAGYSLRTVVTEETIRTNASILALQFSAQALEVDSELPGPATAGNTVKRSSAKTKQVPNSPGQSCRPGALRWVHS